MTQADDEKSEPKFHCPQSILLIRAPRGERINKAGFAHHLAKPAHSETIHKMIGAPTFTNDTVVSIPKKEEEASND